MALSPQLPVFENSRQWRLYKVDYALKDIQDTLRIWQGVKDITDPYIVKLYREFDELSAKKAKLLKEK